MTDASKRGRAARAKGAKGENELAGLIRDLTGWDVRRRVRNHEGESDLTGVPGWEVECKRYAKATRADVRRWWDQAAAQASRTGRIPALFWRQDRDDWRAVWPLMLDGLAWPLAGYDLTVEGSLEAWAAAAREAHRDTPPDVYAQLAGKALEAAA